MSKSDSEFLFVLLFIDLKNIKLKIIHIEIILIWRILWDQLSVDDGSGVEIEA